MFISGYLLAAFAGVFRWLEEYIEAMAMLTKKRPEHARKRKRRCLQYPSSTTWSVPRRAGRREVGGWEPTDNQLYLLGSGT
jgi:hypothetical protein